MTARFEDLWNSADDGASARPRIRNRAERRRSRSLDRRLVRERSDRIECSLLLDQARRLIHGFLADGEISPLRRQAGHALPQGEPVSPNPGRDDT